MIPSSMEYILGAPEYFAPLPNLGMALERIGLKPDEDLSPSLENLQKIMSAHLLTVPYENLDIYDYYRAIDFSVPHLFEKFVLNRRGGYCYEINGFFMSLLQALGYDCYALSGRLLFGRTTIGPMSHRTTIVTINGIEYLCDVGYGSGCAEGPVRVDYTGIQEIEGRRFSIRHHDGDEFGDMTLVKHVDQGEEEFYTCYKRPHTPLEFIGPNYNTSTNYSSNFKKSRIARLKRPDGAISIEGKIFRVKKGDTVTEEEIASGERLYEILTVEFNMIVPRLSFSSDFKRRWFFTPEEKRAGKGSADPAIIAEDADRRGKYTPTMAEYFAPLPDMDAALQRIGLSREEVAEKSEATLAKIMLACLRTVPFENLDIVDYRRHIDFSLPHLHEKIVLNRRGGYCYELNSFFYGLMQGLGYECIPLGARLMLRTPATINAQAHRTTMVLLNGARYLCDIGFGMDGNADGPVNLETTEIQEIRGRQFRVEHHPGDVYGDLTIFRLTDNGWETFFSVYTRPHTPLEFIGVNYNMSNNFNSSRFVTYRTVRLQTATGSIAIDGTIFRRRVDGEKIEEEITTNKRLYDIVTEEFKMIVPKISFSTSFPRLWF